jgi:hypothetical protein
MQIVRQPDEDSMMDLVQAVASDRLPRDAVRDWSRRRASEGAGEGTRARRPRPFVFQYKPPNKGFSVSLKFDEHRDVEPERLLGALEEVVAELREEVSKGRDPRQVEGAKTRRPKTEPDQESS